jgi:hypothetical protein
VDVEDFFDDPLTEACTRVIEQKYKKDNKLAIPPFMFAEYDRKNSKEKVYNSYLILINCGLHTFAENLRTIFRQNSGGVDLKDEPMCSK